MNKFYYYCRRWSLAERPHLDTLVFQQNHASMHNEKGQRERGREREERERKERERERESEQQRKRDVRRVENMRECQAQYEQATMMLENSSR